MGPSAQKPAMRVRQSGGFNQGFGNFTDEHLEENSMRQAVQQKALQQQGTNTGTKSQQKQQGTGTPPPPPREVSTIKDEGVRAVKDVLIEIRQFFSLNTWLNINPQTKDPGELAKQKQTHQRWQRLNQEQQAVAKKMYQEEVQRKKILAEQEERKNQQKRQQEADALPMPSSPKKGPVGPSGSKKQKAINKLQQDRQKMSGPSGAN